MASKTRRTTRAAVAAAAVVAAVAAPPQAAGHPDHTSCRGFGLEHAFFARELGGLGQFFRAAAPLEDETAFEHELFCESE